MSAEGVVQRSYRTVLSMSPARRRILLGAGFLLFCLLPLSLWLYLIFPAGFAQRFPWREGIVFGVPVATLILLRARVPKVLLRLVSFCTIAFLLILLHTLFTSNLPVIAVVLGAIPYGATGLLLLYFFSLEKRDLRYLEKVLPWAMVIGGGGLVIDFASGYAISLMIEQAGVSRVSQQISIVPRALFLYAGTAHAASILSFTMVVVLLSKSMLPGKRPSRVEYAWLIFAFGIAVLGILVTFSRVGFVAIFLLMLYWLAYRRDWKVFVVGALAAVAVSMATVSLINESGQQMLIARVESLVDPNSAEKLDLGRTHLWREAVIELDRNWAFGTGIGSGNPRTKNYGVNVRHYESFPMWVLNEAGIFAASIMFLPYILPVFFIFAASIPLSRKFLCMYLVLTVWLIVFVNPGGGNLETVVMACFFSALFRFMRGPRIPPAQAS